MDAIITPRSVISNYLVTLYDEHSTNAGTYSMEELEQIFGLYKMIYILKGLHNDFTAVTHF